MSDAITLPIGLSLGIIAFLLSLLPAGFFIWLWYLRRRDQTLPAGSIALAFGLGLALVVPAFWIEDIAEAVWGLISPATVHYFAGSVLPLQSIVNVFGVSVGTFFIVSTIEEGLRYGAIRLWIRTSRTIDQVFDGLLIGFAIGLGFATLENTLYFLNLFQSGSFDTLVFVFFLRFLMSTLAHISFGGIMGALIAQGVFNVYRPRAYYLAAFLIPWFFHGLYDLLLGIEFGLYAVIILLPLLIVLIHWTERRDFLVLHRKHGRLLLDGAPSAETVIEGKKYLVTPARSSWNVNIPWLRQTRSYDFRDRPMHS